jgi:PAS domain S-box-containing protein
MKAMQLDGTEETEQPNSPSPLAGLRETADRLRQTEEELRSRTAFFEAMANSSNDGFLVVDGGNGKILQNERFNEMWKLPRYIIEDTNDEAQLAWVAGMVKDSEQFVKKVRHLYASRDAISQDEIELKDGSIFERYSSPVIGRKGEHYGRIWIFRDITERKKLEQRFIRAQRMESIGTLAGGIAHDLNNILAPIVLSIGLLKNLAGDVQSKQLLRTIETSANRGVDIIRQVLSFARGMESAKIEVQPQTLLKELEGIMRDTFPRDIRVRFSIPADIRALWGDPSQVHRVLLNFCLNARDAMPQGGTLTVSAENLMLEQQHGVMDLQAKAGPYVAIGVTDTGAGMSPKIVERIFEPFFTTKTPEKGTGLGLATTLSIVRSHGGIIKVSSEPGRGSTFTVYFPAVEPGQVSADSAQASSN